VTATASITWEIIAREAGCFLRETLDGEPPCEFGPVPDPEAVHVLITGRRLAITEGVMRQVRTA
jgi:hypothetical protein